MYTLDELVRHRENPNIGHMYALACVYIKAGYTGDYRIRYNTMHNGALVIDAIPDIGADDLSWLSNQIARIIGGDSDGTYECVDNPRMCRGNTSSELYQIKQSRGCCGFYDTVLTNPKTRNSFCFGFNHGH